MNGLLRMMQGSSLRTLDIADAIQGQWVNPNITLSTAGSLSKIYVGTAGTGGQFKVARIDSTTLVAENTVLQTNEVDDHNVPAVIETNTGKLMAAYATHSLQPRVWTRLSASTNDDDWGAVRTLNASDTATYMQLARRSGQGRIWMLYRVGNSSAGNWAIRYSDDEGATWAAERNLAPNTYLFTAMDPDGTHLRCFGYEHPVVGAHHDIRYFRINLANGDVVDSEGTVYGNVVDDTGLPITEAEQHLIVDVTDPTSTRLYECGKVGVPSILASEFTSSGGGTYYRYTYDTATGLFTRQAVTTSGPAFFESTSNYFGGACFAEDSLDVVYCARNIGTAVGLGGWELVRMETADGGATWTNAETIRTTGNIIARPQVKAGRLWWSEVTDYPAYTDFEASVRSIEV
jgi:hypothetical protein